jgi:hypothetical protein
LRAVITALGKKEGAISYAVSARIRLGTCLVWKTVAVFVCIAGITDAVTITIRL